LQDYYAIDKENRLVLKPFGFLTRDSRIKERKKYGLRKARKAPHFQNVKLLYLLKRICQNLIYILNGSKIRQSYLMVNAFV
jgi:hypothetical protein